MKIVIQIQDLESRGDRWKYAGGNTYVIRNLSNDDIDKYDSIYFKEYLETYFSSSYTGLLPTEEYEMQSYISDIKVAKDNDKECDPWIVPYTLVVDFNNGQPTLFAHRFTPRDAYWNNDVKFKDIIGYVEEQYITDNFDHSCVRGKAYVNKGDTNVKIRDFVHTDFTRKPYDIYDQPEAS